MLTATLLSLLTGLVGAWTGFLFAQRKSRSDQLAKLRLDAYVDFIKAISHLVSARRLGRTVDDALELGALNEAKARICICAPNEVVEALENFWLQGGTLELEGEVVAFSRLCRAMRGSLGSDARPYAGRYSDILFRLEPSRFSYRASQKKEP
jgi:hypothetical protein